MFVRSISIRLKPNSVADFTQLSWPLRSRSLRCGRCFPGAS
jgi:hypothetical protein